VKSPLKILQVASAMPHWAGTEKYILDLTTELRRLGHDVVIGCRRDSELRLRAEPAGIPTVCLQVDSAHSWNRLPSFVKAMRKQFDVVHIHHPIDYIVPAAAARVAGVPAVLMTRHLPHKFSSRAKAYACSELFYDVIIAVSESVRQTLLECGVKPSRIRTINNGIDVAKPEGAHAASFRASLGLPPGALLLAAAGRLEPAKGFHVLIRAVDAARRRGVPAFAVIAGQGTQQTELERLREELGVTEAVRMLGFRDDVLDVISAADAVVVPSTRPDSFPYAVLEAMACAKPVIASRVGGIPEMIGEEECAILALPESVTELTNAIVDLARNPMRRAEMGRRALRRVRDFTVSTFAANVEMVYLETLNASEAKQTLAA
jgi:glycosyltransferase involved in cell wall biosynthesis